MRPWRLLALLALTPAAAHAQFTLAPLPIQHFVDNSGNALSGGQLFTYQCGTTTLQATYTDATGATPQTNPVILNSRGEPENTMGNSIGLWMAPGTCYKLVLSPSTDTNAGQHDQLRNYRDAELGRHGHDW